jgi:nucleoid DNA-binding protein
LQWEAPSDVNLNTPTERNKDKFLTAVEHQTNRSTSDLILSDRRQLPEREFVAMKKAKGGKSRIVKDVMAKGFTARKAEEAVNTVFSLMQLALQSGAPVEVPGGTLQAKARKGKSRMKSQRFRNVNKKKIAFRFVRYPGARRVVKFTPDPNLDLTPLPLPETPEQVEALQLASALLGKPANKAIMARLQQAVEVHPFKEGALLRRLRECKSRGRTFDNVEWLANQISAFYWL